MKIISGGQTGADRAALDFAIRNGIPHGGSIPMGRKTEDGPLPERYKLKELASDRYSDRTERNVLDSDGTLILSMGPLSGGSALTLALARSHGRPSLHLDLGLVSLADGAEATIPWVLENRVEILNIAGPRAGEQPGIYTITFELLDSVLRTPMFFNMCMPMNP